MPESFSWMMFIPGVGTNHDRLAIAHAWVVALGLLMVAFLVRGRLNKARTELSNEDLVPDDRLTLKNAFELYVEGISGMMQGMLSKKDTRRFFWLIGTLFIYIFFSNLMGVLPGFLPSTENINTNAALAIVVFLFYNLMGFREHGVGYLKQFMGPVIFLAPLMIVIEIISHLVRPASLSIRLFGNINGDHIVLGIFSQIIPGVGHWLMSLGIPIPFILLGIFVAFIQAFVFSLLSTVYIAGAISHNH